MLASRPSARRSLIAALAAVSMMALAGCGSGDGGGSSALWIRGVVVNAPSDPAGERAVGNALFVRRVGR